MVNAVSQIDEYLGYGANAIEADLQFNDDGTTKEFRHGSPCDCWRYCKHKSPINDYIDALRQRTHPNSKKFNTQLVLFMFDVKIKYMKKSALSKAGQDFVNKILYPLYKNNPTKMKVIVSVPDLTKKDFIVSVMKQIKIKQPDIQKKIGYDINWPATWSTQTWRDIERELKGLGVDAGHAWLSSGITNCSPYPVFKTLKSQVKYRNAGNYFSKVYGWSVDYKNTAKSYFKAGVDGVIANYPDRVKTAIEEMKEKENVRLATLDDDPFVA